MIAVEIFLVLVVMGLIAVFVLQKRGSRQKRRMKGDAVKSPEELQSHRPRR